MTESTGVARAATGQIMHACGHDVHLAAAVAAARAIAACGYFSDGSDLGCSPRCGAGSGTSGGTTPTG